MSATAEGAIEIRRFFDADELRIREFEDGWVGFERDDHGAYYWIDTRLPEGCWRRRVRVGERAVIEVLRTTADSEGKIDVPDLVPQPVSCYCSAAISSTTSLPISRLNFFISPLRPAVLSLDVVTFNPRPWVRFSFRYILLAVAMLYQHPDRPHFSIAVIEPDSIDDEPPPPEHGKVVNVDLENVESSATRRQWRRCQMCATTFQCRQPHIMAYVDLDRPGDVDATFKRVYFCSRACLGAWASRS